MHSPAEKLDLCRQAFARMRNPDHQGATVTGEMEATAENCALHDQLDQGGLIYPDMHFGRPNPGIWARVELQPPRNASAYFAGSIQDLLANWKEAYYKAPLELFLADGSEFCKSGTPPVRPRTKAYLQALQIVEMFREIADYVDLSTGQLKLVFIQKEKLEVPVSYDVSSLVVHEKLGRWLYMLADEIHVEQKRVIVRNVLINTLRNAHPAERFGHLLANFDDLYERFLENYQLYVSEFSVEKVLGEVTEKKLEYVLKLNKIFSDIQGQLLSIPIALVLVGGQMENAGTISSKNVVVWLGALVFASIMSMLVRNQRHNLGAISQEITYQRNKLELMHAALFDRFSAEYDDLKTREDQQNTLIELIDAMVALSLLGTTLLFVWYSGLLP